MKNVIDELNMGCRDTLVSNLGIEFTAVGEDWLEARMPIDKRTLRPGNTLHGGSVMALAETVGGALSMIAFPLGEYQIYGIEINGNHMRRAEGTYVVAKGTFLHKGRRTQVVNVEVRDEFGTPLSVCRITNIVIKVEE